MGKHGPRRPMSVRIRMTLCICTYLRRDAQMWTKRNIALNKSRWRVGRGVEGKYDKTACRQTKDKPLQNCIGKAESSKTTVMCTYIKGWRAESLSNTILDCRYSSETSPHPKGTDNTPLHSPLSRTTMFVYYTFIHLPTHTILIRFAE